MATVDNYKVNIEVVGGAALKTAQADIQGLEGSLGGLTGVLNGLATAGFAAFAALGASALSMADNMADLAAATGISVGTIYNLSTALEQSGGSFDGGSMMIGKFAKALNEAVGGSEKAQEAFGRLGISTQELATMTDEQLFQAAIDGLAGMEDGFAKTALATQLFGKEAKNIDFDALAEGTRNAVDPEMEAALLQAAQFVDDVAAAFRNLQVIAIQSFGPILQVVGKFITDAENMKKVIQVVGALLAAAFAARIVGAIVATVNAMRLLGAAIKAAGVAQAFLTGLTGVGLIAVAASAAAATAAYIALGKAMDNAGKAGAPVATPKGGDTPAPGTQLRDVQTPKGARSAGSAAKSSAESTAEAMRRQTESARETTRQLMLQNEESNKLRELEISLIGISSERANLIKSNAQAQSQATKDIAKLEAEINEERAKGTKANQAVIVELQKQVTEKQNQLTKTQELNRAEYLRTEEIAKQNNLLEYQRGETEIAKELGLQSIKELADGYRLRGRLSKEEYDMLKRTTEIGASHAEKMITLQEKLNAIGETGTDSEIQAILDQMDLEQKRFDARVKNLTAEEEYQAALQKSAAAGLRDAVDGIKEQYSIYNTAQQGVTSLWNNMSQAIDTFVNTGKLKFSDFATSIIRDLARIAAKAAVSNILGAIFGKIFKTPTIGQLTPFAPVSGSLGPPLKFAATGGPVMADKPAIVGEQGPELFVPNSAGKIITNASMNKNAGAPMAQVQPVVNNTYITNNISAIDSRSVAQMFVENRKSLLGASMMARKEMPYGG
jgi:lambda family phage tail tape measure protein